VAAADNPTVSGLYVLLPARGLRAARPVESRFLTRFAGIRSTRPPATLAIADFLAPIATEPGRLAPAFPEPVHVIDSVHENGPKLVSMSDSAAGAFAAADSGLRLVPVRYYRPAQALDRAPASPAAGAGAHPPLTLTVVGGPSPSPIANVKVVAYVSLAGDEGAAGVTDAAGQVSLALGGSPVTLDSLYIAPPERDHWGFYRTTHTVQNGDVIALASIAAPYDDCLRRACAPGLPTDGAGVRVAVIDTGVGPHPDLTVGGGANAVQGEARGDYEDNGVGHGTHVAGIIAGHAAAGAPLGAAPAASLWSGRVFGADGGDATNYSIMKAMILATEDDCDLLNLSLAANDVDTVLQDAIADAIDQGAVVFAAAGNDGRQGLAYPARCAGAVAVTAYGESGAYPADTPHDAEAGSPQAPPEFFANFSNWGAGVGFVGPGVGVISTAVGGGYAVRSGTSMACAATTGRAARLLAGAPALLAQVRDHARSVAIQNLLQANVRAMPPAFGFSYAGSGRL